MKPLVSIIITTFNRLELLKKALNSALSQDYENLQIVISDDKSSDGTAEFCKELNDKRIKYVTNYTHAKSPNGNKNNGFENADGEFICLLDDDDELLDGAISECMNILLDSEFDCVFADTLCEENGNISQRITSRSPYQQSCQMSKIDYHCGRINGEFFKLFRREFVENFTFDERSFGGENELYIRFFEKNVFYYKKPLYIYRIARYDSATKNAVKHANEVAHAYLKTANLCYEIAIKYEPKFIATQYKMAAYYAKIARNYRLMYRSIFKSLSIKFSKEAFVFLLLTPLPSSFLIDLSKFRVKIKEKFGI
jgi:general glycosylation pathway protein